MRLRVLILVSVATTGVASAESTVVRLFRDAAIMADGTLWLAVEQQVRTRFVYSQPPPTFELLERTPTGRSRRIAVPDPHPISALAASPFDDSVWIVTSATVLRRDRTGGWDHVALPERPRDSKWYGGARAVITPISASRALAFRGCAHNCTDVFDVDLDARTVSTSNFDAAVGPAVSDGRGGAWALVADEHHKHLTKRAYARFGPTGWESWSDHGRELVIAGMRARGGVADVPSHVAASPPGLVGVGDSLLWINADGRVIGGPEVPTNGFRWTNDVIAITRLGNEIAVVYGISGFGIDDAPDEVSPVVRWFSPTGQPLRDERVPTPRWWRTRYTSSTPELRAIAAGERMCLVGEAAMFCRVQGSWRTIAGDGQEESSPRSVRALVSVPVGLGYARIDGDGGLGIALRPEVIVVANRQRPPVGIGAFLELVGYGDTRVLGGGLTLANYPLPALSFGADAVFVDGEMHPQLVISGFLGFRSNEDLIGPFDFPVGLRVDVRPSTSHVPGSVVTSLSIDGIGIGVVAYAIKELFEIGD